MTKHSFDDLTLLVTHYNRSMSLEKQLNEFSKQCSFAEIIVSDDCSNSQEIKKVIELQKQYNFRLVRSDSNKGLGNNINKGQKEVKTNFILYVQEDFVPFPEAVNIIYDGLNELQTSPELDIVRLYAYNKFPYLKEYKKGFSEMLFKPIIKGYRQYYYYSDHPHIKRSSFLNKFGPYKEGITPEQTEYRMMINFLKRRGKGIFFNDYKSVFFIAADSVTKRTSWMHFRRQKTYFLINVIRDSYRYLKFNLDYIFQKNN